MAIISDPTIPTPGVESTLSITGGTGTSDATQYELTSVPDRSALSTGFLLGPDDEPIDTWTPDYQGAYGFTAYEYRRFSGRAAYAGDPDADERLELVAKQAGTIYVGATADLPIVTTRGHGATLRLVVLDQRVRTASLVDHTTDVARMAAGESAVVSALEALEGSLISSLDPDFVADINDMCDAYSTHRATGSPVHNDPDTTNVLLREKVNSVDGGILRVNDLYDRYVGHAQALSTGGGWHNTDDGKNLPVVAKATSLGSAIVLKADLRERCYERHRVEVSNPASHDTADNTNTMSAPSVLTSFIVAFLDALVNGTPAASDGEQEAAADIGRALGFTVQ